MELPVHTTKSPSHVSAILALAGLSMLPLSAKAQERCSSEQGTQTSPNEVVGNAIDPFQGSTLSLPARNNDANLPQLVLDKAAMMNISPATIKLEQGKWLECTDKRYTLILEA